MNTRRRYMIVLFAAVACVLLGAGYIVLGLFSAGEVHLSTGGDESVFERDEALDRTGAPITRTRDEDGDATGTVATDELRVESSPEAPVPELEGSGPMASPTGVNEDTVVGDSPQSTTKVDSEEEPEPVNPVYRADGPVPKVIAVDMEAVDARETRDEMPFGRPLPEEEYLEMRRSARNRYFRQANAKYLLGFNEWPGRNGGQLGGIRFDPREYPELAAYEVLSDEIRMPGAMALSTGTVWDIPRKITMRSERFELTISLHVTVKAGWAQEMLLAVPANWSIDLGHTKEDRSLVRGDEIGVALGDVSVWNRTPIPTALDQHARVLFTRNNVFVGIESRNRLERTGPRTDVNLYDLALKIDKQIVSQAVPARDFGELAEHLPKIDTFWIEPVAIPSDPERTRWEGGRIQLGALGEGLRFSWYLSMARGGRFVRVEGERIVTDNERPEYVALPKGTLPASGATVRVCVVGEDLLWTVAETTVLVKPAPDSDD